MSRDGWLQTIGGEVFRPFDPKPETILIEDIAHALSMQARFNGHMKRFYSVAEHSMLVAKLLKEWGHPPSIQLDGLMHDAAEAYIGDLISPLKRAMTKYQIVELHVADTIAAKFNLEHPLPLSVKRADQVMLMAERRDLLGDPPRPWFEDEDSITLPSWGVGPEVHWEESKARFLELFSKLNERRQRESEL